MVKKSIMMCVLAALCLGLTSVAQATIVDANEEWAGTLGPGESFTAIVHYIPNTPDIPEGLMFELAPEPTSTYWFDWEGEGWDTAISSDNKITYVYGPRLTNDTDSPADIFSFKLFYQWDTDADGFDPNWPVYQDVAVFDGLTTLTYDCAWRGTPGGTWEDPNNVTWKQQYYPESEPYENPVPEPATICLLGLAAAILRKRLSKS